MTLEVSVPDPPAQSEGAPGMGYNDVEPPEADASDDYHRDDIEAALAAGAWVDGFEAWAAQTELEESEFRLLERHGLVDGLDFFWDPASEAVAYHAPTLSDDAREALHGNAADVVDAELKSLGEHVSETLSEAYLVREDGRVRFVTEE
ncbi:hypothetical protein [Haloarcula salinisoli]|uniref:DUF7992 domain-containing protein n=1 Tax=Haloarcula salinisoli TaxID=2487746 RepID=A0A8J8CAM3_9EURY|nr:hypothetical protein [Halomicroarcula salinisoli]MBX0288237.1 hypothetical protein [Halomicroarcula salinisoli]MBX0305399.1 hypothetical protein [Halomicroarcula salinisoli]